jgi:hypothetical protein
VEEAVRLLAALVVDRAWVLGADHPETRASRHAHERFAERLDLG